jgi:hypothetical protein
MQLEPGVAPAEAMVLDEMLVEIVHERNEPLAGKARQENKDQDAASPRSWGIASWWTVPKELLGAAVASGRQTRLKHERAGSMC